MAEVVQEILAAEKKAEEVLKKAEQEKERIAAKAREKAMETLTVRKKEIEKSADLSVKDRMNSLEQKKKQVDEKYAKEAQDFGKKAEKNIPKAVKLILAKFKKGGMEE